MNLGSYWPEECRLKCEWLHCYAGLGMVGHGHCFAGGAFWMFCCPEFQDDEEWLKERGQFYESKEANMPRQKKVLTVLEILDKLKEFREKEVELIMLLADQAHAMDTVIGWVKTGVVPSKIIREPGMPKTSRKKTLKGLPASGGPCETTPVSLQDIQHSTATGKEKEESKL